jgi:hypothetical protein
MKGKVTDSFKRVHDDESPRYTRAKPGNQLVLPVIAKHTKSRQYTLKQKTAPSFVTYRNLHLTASVNAVQFVGVATELV